jgi:nondiscriminating aspartyl-tRNA synthetase
MERTLIKDLKSQAGQQVKLQGFVQTNRSQGSIQFLILRDISGTVQIVIADKALLEQTKHLSLESVVEIVGLAKEEPKAFSGVEVEAQEVKVLSSAEPELPIPIVEKGSMNEADREIRLDWRFLDLRKPERQLIYKVWTELEKSFVEFLTERNYIEIHSPKMMSSPSESGAELFEIKYFDRKAYLAQSPQFYKQMAMAAGFERVFEIGPVFRAEPSFTTRHATEFQGFDLEKSFIESHEDIMQEEAEMMAYAIGKIKEKYGEEIKAAFDRDLEVPTLPFPQLTLAEAKKILTERGITSEKDGDLSPEEERGISEYIKEKEGHEFVYITEYPQGGRAFYHMRLESDNNLTKGFDLLWNGVEITTGAQREHRYDVLVKQAQERGMELESLKFYLDFFKYGCPPHGGFGAGPERMMMKLLGLESIREVSFLYRGVKRLTP